MVSRLGLVEAHLSILLDPKESPRGGTLFLSITCFIIIMISISLAAEETRLSNGSQKFSALINLVRISLSDPNGRKETIVIFFFSIINLLPKRSSLGARFKILIKKLSFGDTSQSVWKIYVLLGGQDEVLALG